MKRAALILTACLFLAVGSLSSPARGSIASVKIDVILWFDTEDYILPASDDAALRLATWLTGQDVRATFKVVGEKARTLERRGRRDVIEALKKHEIGYHSNWHSVPPTPAQYLNECGWEDGITEFTRREKPGFDDVARIFGQTPTCYGQPGSSWAPQTHAALHQWGVRIYLDAGQHVNFGGKPFWYGGLLNFYKLTHQLRVGLKKAEELDEAKAKFVQAREQLLTEKGGVVSIVYHPCEFVHQQFWDGVNFREGANPPREEWKLPPTKTEGESKLAYDNFEQYIQFLKRFPEVRFVTATEAARDYPDRAKQREFTRDQIAELAVQLLPTTIPDGIDWCKAGEAELSPAEAFWLLTSALAEVGDRQFTLPEVLSGPSQATRPREGSPDVSPNELRRTAREVRLFLQQRKQVPSTVWVGSRGISPEEYFLLALGQLGRNSGEAPPQKQQLPLRPSVVRLKAQDYVADDGPHLWKWVIFPPNFRAPQVMSLAKRQAWTLKPAVFRPK